MGHQSFIFIGSAILAVVFGAITVRRGWLWGGLPGTRPNDGGRGPGASVRDLRGVDAPIWLVAGLLVLLASMVGAAAAAGLPDAWIGPDKSQQRGALVQLGGYALSILVGVLVVLLLGKRTPGRSGLRLSFGDGPRGALALLMVAPWYVLLSQASQAVSRLVTHEAPTTIKHETLQRLSEHTMDAWSWLTIAGAVIGAPIFEELAYRVFIQAAVLRVTRAAGQGWAAVAITSAVWTMVHLGAVPPSALPSLFLLGLGMGIAYERTQRLGVPIAMHMLFNAINVIAVATGLVK